MWTDPPQVGSQSIVNLGKFFSIANPENLDPAWDIFKAELMTTSFFYTHKGIPKVSLIYSTKKFISCFIQFL